MSKEESSKRHPNVINVDEVEPRTMEKGSRFGASIRTVGRASGATELGCNHFEVAPGRSAFPRHFHCAIEEALFILEGTGTLRIGEAQVVLRPGDWVTLLPGPDGAHQVVNDGEGPLRYLCLSSKARADVVGYPDSNKVGAMASPGPDFFAEPWVRGIFNADAQVGYYDGEEVD